MSPPTVSDSLSTYFSCWSDSRARGRRLAGGADVPFGLVLEICFKKKNNNTGEGDERGEEKSLHKG